MSEDEDFPLNVSDDVFEYSTSTKDVTSMEKKIEEAGCKQNLLPISTAPTLVKTKILNPGLGVSSHGPVPAPTPLGGKGRYLTIGM